MAKRKKEKKLTLDERWVLHVNNYFSKIEKKDDSKDIQVSESNEKVR